MAITLSGWWALATMVQHRFGASSCLLFAGVVKMPIGEGSLPTADQFRASDGAS